MTRKKFILTLFVLLGAVGLSVGLVACGKKTGLGVGGKLIVTGSGG